MGIVLVKIFYSINVEKMSGRPGGTVPTPNGDSFSIFSLKLFDLCPPFQYFLAIFCILPILSLKISGSTPAVDVE